MPVGGKGIYNSLEYNTLKIATQILAWRLITTEHHELTYYRTMKIGTAIAQFDVSVTRWRFLIDVFKLKVVTINT